MSKRCLSFLFCILLSLPSFAGSLSEQIEKEVNDLEKLKTNYEYVEQKLMASEQDLANAEQSLQTVTKDLQAVSKDYEQSQKKLRRWKISFAVAVPISLITGYLLGKRK